MRAGSVEKRVKHSAIARKQSITITNQSNKTHHMQPDTNHSNDNGSKEARQSSHFAPSLSTPNGLSRRFFLRNLGLGAALLAPGAALLTRSNKVLAAGGKERNE